MTRFYLSCLDCRTRMRRTGEKEKEEKAMDGKWLYLREYCCPRCGTAWLFSENKNILERGGFK